MKFISRREFMKRTIHGAGALAASGAILSSSQLALAQKKLEGPVNWLSWSVNHIPQLFKSFEKKYGTSINPVNFEDNAEGYIKAKTLKGKGLDVAQSDGIWPQNYYKAGLIEPMDPDDLEQWPCFKYMFPQFRYLKAWMTPDGKIMQVADDWSPAGIIYVKGKVPAPTSWEALWDPKYKGRIVMNDYVEKNILLAAHILGINGDPLKMSLENLQRCKKLLIDQKPLVKTYLPSSSDIVKAVVAGKPEIG